MGEIEQRPVGEDTASEAVARLRRYTPARIGLGRHGAGLPTAACLDFAEAHAAARDAVHDALDIEALIAALGTDARPIPVESQAIDRPTYLKRPDLGRRLSETSQNSLKESYPAKGCDVLVVIGDGLSPRAVSENAVSTVNVLRDSLGEHLTLGPVVVAAQARVALGDPIGKAMGARLAIMLIGERPGLSAADSLGAYLTFAPEPGRTDAQRNCVSNIRAGGIPPEQAGRKLATLAHRALKLGLSGTGLKDDDLGEIAEVGSSS